MAGSAYWQQLSKKRVSRRAALKGVAGAGALALAGCGGDEDEAPAGGKTPGAAATSAAEGTPQPGGDMKIGLIGTPCHLDSMLCTTLFWISSQHNGYLHGMNLEEGKIFLQMAESIEQPDDVSYIWKLRPGIKFHNVDPTFGRGVVADDILYSFTRRRDEPKVQSDKQLLRDYTKSLEAVDNYTFKMVTTRPYVPTLDETGNPTYPIIPREAVEKFGDLAEHPVGCGAYICEDFVRGERAYSVKNPDFYMAGRPYVDSREWLIIPDPSTLYQAFRTGQTDWNYAGLDKPKREELQQVDDIVIRQSANYWYAGQIGLMATKPPFNDERLREALDLSLDRQDIIDRMAFGEGKFCGPVSADLEFWALSQDEVREFYKVDIPKAKQLLEAAGYGDGFEWEIIVEITSNNVQVSEAIAGTWQKNSLLKPQLKPTEEGIWLAQHIIPGNFVMTTLLNLPYTDPDKPLAHWFSKGQLGLPILGWNDPQCEDWIWKERSEFDLEKRQQIVKDAQRYFMSLHGPVLNTYTADSYSAFWDHVHGYSKSSGQGLTSGSYLGIDLWMTEKG